MAFITHDLNLSGYLLASGCPVLGHSRIAGKTQFEFKQSDKVTDLVESYYSLNAKINPQAFAAAVRNLKNILYQYSDNNDRQNIYEQRKA